MKPLTQAPSLTEQAYQAVVDQICDGSLPAGAHLVQEQIARRLGVSRQPIQQAMALLKADGLIEDAPGRGMLVVPLDIELMVGRYQIRAALDGLAAQLAAERSKSSSQERQRIAEKGSAIIHAGRSAKDANAIKRMIRHDIEFHNFLYECSGNTLIGPTCEHHWLHLRRVMGEVLRKAASPEVIWRQHQEILDAVVEGNANRAKSLATKHVDQASAGLATALSDLQL